MQYTQKDIESFRAKDQRISWLSIFSTLASKFEGQQVDKAVEKAFEINAKLYEAYPFVETERERLEKMTVNKSEVPFNL